MQGCFNYGLGVCYFNWFCKIADSKRRAKTWVLVSCMMYTIELRSPHRAKHWYSFKVKFQKSGSNLATMFSVRLVSSAVSYQQVSSLARLRIRFRNLSWCPDSLIWFANFIINLFPVLSCFILIFWCYEIIIVIVRAGHIV